MFHGPYHMIKKLIGNKRENTSTIGTRLMASGFTISVKGMIITILGEVLAGNQALRLVLGPHFCWLNSCFFSVQSRGTPQSPRFPMALSGYLRGMAHFQTHPHASIVTRQKIESCESSWIFTIQMGIYCSIFFWGNDMEWLPSAKLA
jgi:hypothetical protein